MIRIENPPGSDEQIVQDILTNLLRDPSYAQVIAQTQDKKNQRYYQIKQLVLEHLTNPEMLKLFKSVFATVFWTVLDNPQKLEKALAGLQKHATPEDRKSLLQRKGEVFHSDPGNRVDALIALLYDRPLPEGTYLDQMNQRTQTGGWPVSNSLF